MYKCNIPVLLIAFNRPDTTQRVFDRIRQARPIKLYFAVDAARESKGEDEKLKNDEVKKIIEQVDWDCEVYTLFQKENRGCGFGPAEAITWAFQNEEWLIVLEDDCLPSMSYFTFTEEMLKRYKDDTRIWIVSGRSHQVGSKYFDKQDYIFTHYAHTWGWATWKRCWNDFDLYMKDVPDFLSAGGGLNVFVTKEQGIRSNKGIKRVFDRIDEEVTHSWDSQWSYTRTKNGGLGIVPCVNLIQNIGEEGTHSQGATTAHKMLAHDMPSSELRHPKLIIANYGYECLHYRTHINKKTNIVVRAIAKLFRVLKKK